MPARDPAPKAVVASYAEMAELRRHVARLLALESAVLAWER